MAGRKSDFTLPTNTLDELFSSQEERDEAKLSKIRDIPLEEIDDFPDHPFKVREDEDMFQLVESIKERGVITPATVRQKEDGRYELISGHRRKRACELAGFETLRCEVVDLDRDEATILMVESNFQRSQILPSEKAHAYKGFRYYCAAVLSVTAVFAMSTTAFAASDPLTVVNNLSDFIFGFIRAIGLILLGFGIVQVGLSLKSHDPSQRANGFLTLAGGIIIVFAKEILTLITG